MKTIDIDLLEIAQGIVHAERNQTPRDFAGQNQRAKPDLMLAIALALQAERNRRELRKLTTEDFANQSNWPRATPSAIPERPAS